MYIIRGRAWRRYVEDRKVIKRLRRAHRFGYRWWFIDANEKKITNPKWFDSIGTSGAHDYKTFVTTLADTNYKTSWGKKGKRNYDYSCDPNTRVRDKKRFKKELNELGFKHLPTEL